MISILSPILWVCIHEVRLILILDYDGNFPSIQDLASFPQLGMYNFRTRKEECLPVRIWYWTKNLAKIKIFIRYWPLSISNDVVRSDLVIYHDKNGNPIISCIKDKISDLIRIKVNLFSIHISYVS